MSRRYDCAADPMERTRGIAEAVSAVRRGELIVLPTDTVYGVGADAFTPAAVTALLDAKGRGRDAPPPVLVGSVRAATALVEDLGTYGQDLIDEFWPGALTIVCRANRNLVWDLGDTKGTVAVRMPMHDLAVELLKETGPLAVSSANLSGRPAARSADEAEKMLGDAVSVYLDGGPAGLGEASTIIDLTGPIPRLLRAGAISEDKLRAVVGVLLTDEEQNDDAEESSVSLEKPAASGDKPAGTASGEAAESSAETAAKEPAEEADDSAGPSLKKDGAK
ncbi:L-threonylcarbamoyladenylate synthase [Actinomadura sp. NBRC 104425]|uniref:L-threonylcarbamoyladenylate synthase n=1 Tax=Actinomadura sp. NBRC 104425 TaxID=3032204 RepID=UPI00255695E2|nr:L-threonylcarbamoyladenylate synthase [Actinomadura sp. NBRC 104425]